VSDEPRKVIRPIKIVDGEPVKKLFA